MKRSLVVLTVAVVSTLALTGCPGDSGKDSSVAIANGQINSFANESCNIPTTVSGTYTCSQTINGMTYTTQPIFFNTQQELCSKLNDYSINSDRNQPVAQQTRAQQFAQRCGGTTQLPPTSTTPTMDGFKVFTCQLQVRKGDAVFQGDAQSAYLPKSGGTLKLIANSMVNDKFWKYFNRTHWQNIGTVTMKYIPALSASSNSMDQISMSVKNVDGDITASVTGFAGAENKIEITPQDADGGDTTLIASCSSSDAVIKSQLSTTDKYSCVGTETINGRTNSFAYVNQISDVIASGIWITHSVFVQAEDGNAVNFTQQSNSFNDSAVNLTSSLSALTSASITKSGYSLNVKCLPK